eukprot:gene39750-49124_t
MCKKSLVGVNPFAYVQERCRLPGHMSDIVDSPVFEDHTADMHNQFVAFKRDVYKASVLNCDPSYRSKMGLGLFSVAIHNLDIGSPAEQSLIDDLLTEELKQLENGILFEFELDNGEKKALFLQTRALCWNVDTRACARCRGLCRTLTGSPAYVGATLFLPQDHALRHLAARPMPEGYFGEDAEVNARLGAELAAAARQIPVQGDNVADAVAAVAVDNEADQRDEIVNREG